MVEHVLQFRKRGLIFVRHKKVMYEWDALYAAAIPPKDVAHEPLINYGER